MPIIRTRCPRCNQLSFRLQSDRSPFTCQNNRCADIAETEPSLQRPTREEFMREFGLVYYVSFADRIKIGTTTDLTRRLSVLPHDDLLAFERGSYDVERTRLNQFAHALIPGQREWFSRAPDLLEHIATLSAGMSDVRLEATRAVKRALLGLVG